MINQLRILIFLSLCLCSQIVFAKPDSNIASKILQQIRTDPLLAQASISVEVGRGRTLPFGQRKGELGKGVVVLSGYVLSEQARIRAAEITETFPEVRTVENELLVDEKKASDNKLAWRVRDEIARVFITKPYRLQVFSQGGEVTLEGEVFSAADRTALEDIARRTFGVTGVENMISIRAISDEDLEDEIVQALLEVSDSDLSQVQVSVKEGTAYFSGAVANHREIDRILSLALMVQGIRDVSSELTINGRPYH